jgi:N-methylhydantoinase A
VPKAALTELPPATGPATDALLDTRRTFLPEAGGWSACPVYDRDRLAPGHTLSGPAIVEQMDSTTLILPAQRAEVDRFGNLIVVDEEVRQ